MSLPRRIIRPRVALALASALGLAGLLAAACTPAADDTRFLSIGTAGTGGVYYPLGGAIAGRMSVADPERRYTAEVTGGSVENVNRVVAGEMDLGMAMGTTVREAFAGAGDFERPLEELRIVAPLYPNVTHVVVLAGSPVRSIDELAGRRVSVGPPGSGTEQLARQLLQGYGLDYDSVDEVFLSFTESSAALRDGAVDAAIVSAGHPAAAVLEISSSRAIRLLPIDGEPLARIRERHPFYMESTIPAGAYPGVDEAVPTLAVMNWVVARADLDAEVARTLLDVLSDERDQLVQVNEIARQIDLAALADAPIPLHPAAEGWLAERGDAAADASADADDELVLGVVVDGQPMAFPETRRFAAK